MHVFAVHYIFVQRVYIHFKRLCLCTPVCVCSVVCVLLQCVSAWARVCVSPSVQCGHDGPVLDD